MMMENTQKRQQSSPPSPQQQQQQQSSPQQMHTTTTTTTTTSAAATTPASGDEHQRFVNRLINEQSPYLLQHAHNPVDWYPWGEEAFKVAREQDKPIFLSVGYSTCHWCHVMAHEAFENEEIAQLMNDNFVNIKVDREERPDVDRVYMTFVQATTGGGGWPMSVFLAPDTLKPFFGGTYFAPYDKYGQPGFPTLLKKVHTLWNSQKERLIKQADDIMAMINTSQASAMAAQAPEAESISQAHAFDLLISAVQRFARMFDPDDGGFGHAPKFPRPVVFNLFFRVYFSLRVPKTASARAMPSGLANDILSMCQHTLVKMAHGGMYDHIGGGFHRYSVDAQWHVPHFEKMLYDNAQLVSSYLDAFQITGDPFFQRVARDTLTYVLRDMSHPEGGFFSAEDADSATDFTPNAHRVEGAFYAWAYNEIVTALSEGLAGSQLLNEAGLNASKAIEVFCHQFDVHKDGNVQVSSDPQGELRGKNVLIRRHSSKEAAETFGLATPRLVDDVTNLCKTILFDHRNRNRPRPHLDDKILCAWNGLMISALVRAYQILDDQTYLEAAKRAAQFIRNNMFNETKGVLMRSFRKETSSIDGFLSDYAFFIQGLIDMYEATGEIKWLTWGEELQTKQNELFLSETGGFYDTTGTDSSILLRQKEDYDGAEPSGNAISAMNLLRLSHILNHALFNELARKVLSDFQHQMQQMGPAVPQMLCALDQLVHPVAQFIVAGQIDKADMKHVLHTIHSVYMPRKVIIHAGHGAEYEGRSFIEAKIPLIRNVKPIDDKASVYFCQDYACQMPTNNPSELMRQMRAAGAVAASGDDQSEPAQ